MANLTPTVLIEVELSGAGSGWTDLRAAGDVAQQGLTVRHGITGSTPADNVAGTGTASFTLRNSTLNSGSTLGYYSPNHASARTGWGLGIGCRVRIQDPVTLTYWTRFRGRIDVIDPTPGKYGERVVHVVAVDWMDEAARFALTPAIGEQVNQPWDAVLGAILAQMATQPAAVDLSAGTEVFPYALDTSDNAKQRALAEFKKLANSEAGFVFLKADGTLRAENRHTRMTASTSVWTLADTDYQALELPSTRDDVINSILTTTHSKIVDAAPTSTVYSQANTIAIDASSTKRLIGPYRDADTGDPIGATEIQPLIAGVGYIANTASDGSGADATSSVSIVAELGASGALFDVTNSSGATVYLTTLQLTGKRILDRGTTQHPASDATSIALHGEHVVEFDMPYQSSADVGQGAADYFLAKFKNPLAQARRITVLATTAALLTQILTRDISDRITLSETVTGVSDDFFINGVELSVTPNGHVHAAYVLAPAADPYAALYWLLGTSTLGTDTLLAPF
jgi:hypothetical protein